MALQIAQAPLTYANSAGQFSFTPVGQQLMFTVSSDTIVSTKYNVKFVADVYISNQSINLSNTNKRIGTFRTTPNNAGVGIFDLRPVIETFVKADNDGSTLWNGSRYKQLEVPHPIHLIDQYAGSENGMRYMAVNFYVEYSDDVSSRMITSDPEPSAEYVIFNGVLQYDNPLTLHEGNYGFNMLEPANLQYTTLAGGFLSNAPTTQYARVNDYGTFPFINFAGGNNLTNIVLTYYWSGGSSTETITNNWANGGLNTNSVYVYKHLLYFGGFPANLQNWSSTFATAVGNGLTHYTIQGNTTDIKTAANLASEIYTINIICADNEGYNRGYESIRLGWLNQWGAWDYYTFNMKSIRSIDTKRVPYTQQGGTWNESTFKIKGWKGGKKNFRVNSTEKIKINTDFVTEAEGVWFEELINSPEVYILEGFQLDTGNYISPSTTITYKYVKPVTLTTSSYIKKTVANDKLMQYTFEIEKSRMKRTQAI